MDKLNSVSNGNGPLIEITGLSKDYPTDLGVIRVLKEINLKIERGEMTAIMGPSGSGKSTLLYILGLFLQPTAGSYRFGGFDVLHLDRAGQATFRRRQVGFVFQSCDLLENTTVYENLEFPLIYAGVDRREREVRVVTALGKVNLSHRLHHPANHLSGGERQRVAVARALVNEPQMILADEPTGQLDQDHSHLIMDDFAAIVATGKTSIILVTHDSEIAARCGRVKILRDGVLRGG